MAAHPDRVVRAAVPVRYVEVRDVPDEVPSSFPALEARVGSLRGRRFLAAFSPEEGWYRACVQSRPDASEAESSLPEMEVPGGAYLRVRLRGEPPALYDEIAPAFRLLEDSAERDPTRPALELYRREGEVDVLMPVR
ncbi:MAG TPA: hypothetical protein VFL59_08730 [Candidatus Nanopelagicales bacterium]|nr:hypothetical protein [Candidatus Nanopelagicales bacterium]